MPYSNYRQDSESMKKSIFTLIITLLLVGCKIETLSNGQFDGFWHLEKTTNVNDGQIEDVSNERIYWAVEGKLLQVRHLGNPEGGNKDFLGYYLRFTKTDKELVLFEPYINGWHEDQGHNGGDTPLKDITLLERYGILNIPEHYKIEKLTGNKMILVSENLKLHFTKQ